MREEVITEEKKERGGGEERIERGGWKGKRKRKGEINPNNLITKNIRLSKH